MDWKGQIQVWRTEGARIVFTNGVFDLLHRGHVTYLAAARAKGDRLVVGVNSDASVRRLEKGPNRPINRLEDRCFVLEGLKSVDLAIPFEEDTPIDLIELVAPDVLVKGGDYNADLADPSDPKYIVGREAILAKGGQVLAIPFVQGHSTTDMLNRSSGA
jgi:rfaE bifunctional protein nucleotidyltransferase chain/domain